MLRGRGTCRRVSGIARETGSSGFVEHSNLSCGASFADEKTRKKSPNRSLVEAKSDLPCSRVWSVRRVKRRLNSAPPCCHDCNQMAFLIAVCVTRLSLLCFQLRCLATCKLCALRLCNPRRKKEAQNAFGSIFTSASGSQRHPDTPRRLVILTSSYICSLIPPLYSTISPGLIPTESTFIATTG